MLCCGVSLICSFFPCLGISGHFGRASRLQPSSTQFVYSREPHTTYSLARIVVWLRRNARNKTVIKELDEMRTKTQSLFKFHTMLFLLFGLSASNEVFNVLRGIQNSAVSLSGARFDVFGPVVAFAFVVFAVLLFLHGFRWAVVTVRGQLLPANNSKRLVCRQIGKVPASPSVRDFRFRHFTGVVPKKVTWLLQSPLLVCVTKYEWRCFYGRTHIRCNLCCVSPDRMWCRCAKPTT